MEDNKDTKKKTQSKSKTNETKKKTTTSKKKESATKNIKQNETKGKKTIENQSQVVIQPIKKEVKEKNKETANETKYESKTNNNSKDFLKAYEILAYISIFWIIGILVPEKDNKDLKFHIGQGIILTVLEVILSLIVSIINNVLIANIFRTEVTYWGIRTGVYTTSSFGLTLMSIFNFIVVAISIVYAIIGIKNVLENKKEELPIIGKYSFYK